MRSFILISLLCCLFLKTLSRPQEAIENNDESKGEKDMEFVAAGENTPEDDDGDNEQNSSSRQETKQAHNMAASGDIMSAERRIDNELSMQENSEYFTDCRPNKSGLQAEKDISDENEIDRSNLKRIQNTYVENSDMVNKQEKPEHLKYQEISANKLNEKDFLSNKSNKKQVYVQSQDSLFDVNSNVNNIDERKYDTTEVQNPADLADSENFVDENYDNSQYFLNRDIRQVTDTPQQSDTTGFDNNEFGNIVAEDEETAIKRYIKKLSKDELKELKDSLSDDKKILLKNFIEKIDSSQISNEAIHKREITKKDGAVDETNLMDSELTNSLRNEGVTSDSEVSSESSVSQNTKNKETEQTVPDSESSMTTLKNFESTGSENKSIITNDTEKVNLKNKRDINSVVFSEMQKPMYESQSMKNSKQNWQELSNEKDYDYSPDEDLSHFASDESQKQHNFQNKKRDVNSEYQADFCNSIKNLEDSFPNSNTIDGSIAYSGPLIRVKRHNSNQVVKKRPAEVLPAAKVSYFTYESQNDNEDNDESNEFDNEGFYGRNSNFAKENQPNENLSDDKTSLGSDSDNVLSGVEDTDDNLMFSSSLRDKRIARDDNATDKQLKSSTEYSLSQLNYQENDAFGPLPRNYEGDLGRYKRIRRLQQSQSPLDDNI